MEKREILSVYNALNGTSYDNVDDISITTIDDVIYIKMKNDVSLLLNGNLSIWEQQSSINPNMPVRGLMYFGNLYSQYITTNKLNIYGKKLQKIPTPKYVVFYNGNEELDAITTLRLSDAFINEDKNGDFEWTATVYNLNRGKNDELLKKCKPLSEYMELINRIRDNSKMGMDFASAVDLAIKSCIQNGIMSDFLKKHRAEVKNMCITEFDEKVYEDGIREEGRAEGIAVGLAKGRAEERTRIYYHMFHKNRTPEDISDLTGESLEYLYDLQKKYLATVHEKSQYDIKTSTTVSEEDV